MATRTWLALPCVAILLLAFNTPGAEGDSLYVGNAGSPTSVTSYRSEASGNAAPAKVLAQNGAVGSLAFDGGRDLWVGAGSGADGTLEEYTPTLLGEAGTPKPAITIATTFAGVNSGAAFDSSGNLWIASLGGRVEQFAASQLTASGNEAASVVLNVPDPNGVAFDGSGDLWVSNFSEGTISMYTASQLTASGSPTPTVVISGSGLDQPARLTFDASGALWVANFGGDTVVKYGPEQLKASGSPAPQITLTARGESLSEPNGLTFDSGGNLWVVDEANSTLVEFAAGQLGSSGDPAPVDTIGGSATGISTPYVVATGQAAAEQSSSATQVICNLDVASGIDTCGATIGDTGLHPTNPTGSVAFSIVSGSDTEGTFPNGSTCGLQPTPGSGDVSFCSVEFKPASTDTDFPHIHAAYGGDSLRLPSAADTAPLGACVSLDSRSPANKVLGQQLLGSATAQAAAVGGKGPSFYNPVHPCKEQLFPLGYLEQPKTKDQDIDPTGGGEGKQGVVGRCMITTKDGLAVYANPKDPEAGGFCPGPGPQAERSAASASRAGGHKKKIRGGTKVSYRLKGPAVVTFWVARVLPHKHGERPRLALRRGHFTLLSRPGQNSFRFSGWIGGHRLKPGSYVLIARPFLQGSVGIPRVMRFRVG